jgi:uncharacterized protein (UPF0261 family)
MIVTLDTKETEARYIRSVLEAQGVEVIHLDPSIRRSITPAAEITPEQVAGAAGKTIEEVRAIGHEGKCQAVMTQGAIKLTLDLHARTPLSGVIAVGGSMGSSLGSSVMQALPYGLPKVLVSTMASGYTVPFVGAKDICMFNPVCDIAGINSITGEVFHNAAVAVAGMAHQYVPKKASDKPIIAMGTLGTIDRCTVRIRRQLEEKGYEVLVFHTLGTGGTALDQIVGERDVVGVIETSVVEHNDFLNNGLCSAGPDRSKAGLKKGVPVVFAPGNADFMVSGPIEMAERQFPGKRYHIHNKALTAVRTEKEELERLAQHLAGLVREGNSPVSVLVPLQGFSHHDSPEGHLHDPSLCPVFLEAARQAMPESVKVESFDCHLNDAQFADAVVQEMLSLIQQRQGVTA